MVGLWLIEKAPDGSFEFYLSDPGLESGRRASETVEEAPLRWHSGRRRRRRLRREINDAGQSCVERAALCMEASQIRETGLTPEFLVKVRGTDK